MKKGPGAGVVGEARCKYSEAYKKWWRVARMLLRAARLMINEGSGFWNAQRS
jgi:hypothetical protein